MNNLDLMRKRLQFNGGEIQQARMIESKYKSFQKALLYSYQSEKVQKKGEAVYDALINPDKLNPDYDNKIISIDNNSGFKTGDIFKCLRSDTYWIIYLQQLTEKAYFRGSIRKCSFEISWKDGDSIKRTFAAIRGPVETKINSYQKHQISFDDPNYSLHILMPKNEDTLKYFKRYSKFYLQMELNIEPICWRVETVDYISTPGILEVTALEYYANKDEDDLDNKVAGGLILTPEDPNKDIKFLIEGPDFIKPQNYYSYFCENLDNEKWVIDNKKLPIKQRILDNQHIEIKWTANYSGKFKLSCGKYEKIIQVQSLF